MYGLTLYSFYLSVPTSFVYFTYGRNQTTRSGWMVVHDLPWLQNNPENTVAPQLERASWSWVSSTYYNFFQDLVKENTLQKIVHNQGYPANLIGVQHNNLLLFYQR